MILDNIDILNFKNIGETRLQFSAGVNCLLGMNGMGKSNLLEAIHFMCMTRPMTALPEGALIRHGEDMLIVKGDFVTDGGTVDSVSCGVTRGRGKSIKRNGKEYRRLSEHIGRYPVVCVTPADSQVITGAAEERRKLMDMVISQANPDYLAELINYNKLLESRNSMLRRGVDDPLLYESVEAGMCRSGEYITEVRRQWTETIAPETDSFYCRLSGDAERTSLTYRPQTGEGGLQALLDSRREKDRALGYTSAGPHRDDLVTGLEGYSLRRLGSQGQIKTFTVALKLAIFDYIRRASGITPILLLDDIFDKLDAARVANIMHEVSASDNFGQIFITDTNRKHLDDILGSLDGPKVLVNVDNGVFTPINTQNRV